MNKFEKDIKQRVDKMQSAEDLSDVWKEIQLARAPHKKNKRILPWVIIGFITSLGLHSFWSNTISTKEEPFAEQLIPNSNFEKHLATDSEQAGVTLRNGINSKDSMLQELLSNNAAQKSSDNQQQEASDYTPTHNQDVTKPLISDNTVMNSFVGKSNTLSKQIGINNKLTDNESVLPLKSNDNHSNIKLIETISLTPIACPEVVPALEHAFSRSLISSDKNAWSFIVSTNYGKTRSSFTPNMNQSQTQKEIFELRSLFESDFRSAGVVLGIEVDLNEKFFVRTGIDYQYNSIKYKYQYNNVRTELRQDTVLETVTQGVSSYKLEDVPITISETREGRRYLDYHQIGLPFSLGYRYQVSENLNVRLMSGISLGIISKNVGFVLSDPLDFTIQKSLDSAGYKSSILLTGTGTISIEKKLRNRVFCSAGLRLSKDLIDRVADNFGYNHTFNSINAQLGLRIKL